MSTLSIRNCAKLKTNLRLAMQRLKLVAKKKAEMVQKSRREIADYLQQDKVERARIRVEHIIREDYLVEAMDIVEMYCDTVLARFGLLQQTGPVDEGIAEAVASLLWASPRLNSEVKELQEIAQILTLKFGKEYAALVHRAPASNSVNEALMLKLGVQSPPKALVERYLIEIARIFDVSHKLGGKVILGDDECGPSNSNNNSSNGAAPSNSCAPQVPPISVHLARQETTKSQSDNAGAKNSKPQKAVIITDLDESIFPAVPNFSEDSDSSNIDAEQEEGPRNGGSSSDHFDDIKRRFAALKKKK